MNGKLLPTPGYLRSPGTTMVPVHGVFEYLGAIAGKLLRVALPHFPFPAIGGRKPRASRHTVP
ncbi:MAG: hypothetical protein AB1426_11405 [Bacillota bacterium]